MTNTFRMLMLTGALAGAFAVSTGAAAKEITVALASTFTTMDPYDAGDTLSQNSAKSMYEGLFGLDKDMKLKNLKTVESTLSQIRRRRARGTSGLWPSSP